MTIYEIQKKYFEIEELIIKANFQTDTDIDILVIKNQSDFKEKVSDYIFLINNLKKKSDYLKEEINRLKNLSEANDKLSNRMQSTIISSMKIFGLEKIHLPLYKLSVRSTKSVEILNLEAISDEYKNIKYTVAADKLKIKKVIQGGEIVDGAEIRTNFTLNIK